MPNGQDSTGAGWHRRPAQQHASHLHGGFGKPKGNSFTLKDTITGEIFTVTADVVINAGGAWIDKVNAGLGIASHYMGGSRGAHLIVKHQGLMQALKGLMTHSVAGTAAST